MTGTADDESGGILEPRRRHVTDRGRTHARRAIDARIAGSRATIAIARARAARPRARRGIFARENLQRSLPRQHAGARSSRSGTTLVILTGNIDISVGSVFAICSVVAGVAAKAAVPMPLRRCIGVRWSARRSGALNGALVAYLRIPSIVVTLATMVALRDGLRWGTQGAWVQDLPAGFQWFGSAAGAYPFVACASLSPLLVDRLAWMLRTWRPAARSTRPARTRRRRGSPGFDTARVKLHRCSRRRRR